MRRAKKGQQKVPILKQTTLLCPSRCNFSMVPAYTSIYEDTEKRQMASSSVARFCVLGALAVEVLPSVGKFIKYFPQTLILGWHLLYTISLAQSVRNTYRCLQLVECLQCAVQPCYCVVCTVSALRTVATRWKSPVIKAAKTMHDELWYYCPHLWWLGTWTAPWPR